jgi:hypothetical protein
MPSGLGPLQEAVGWLHPLVALAGVVVCAVNLHRSRWMWILVAGFGLEAAVSAAYRAFALLMGRGVLSYSSMGALFFLMSLLGLAAAAAIVGGLAAVLADPGGVAPVKRAAPPDPR